MIKVKRVWIDLRNYDETRKGDPIAAWILNPGDADYTLFKAIRKPKRKRAKRPKRGLDE